MLVDAERPYAGGEGFDEAAARTVAEHAVERAADPTSATNHLLVVGQGEATFDLGDLAVPTLVVHGADDPLFPLAHGEALAAEIPDATLLVLPGGGHGHPTPRQLPTVLEALVRHTAG
ncbi:alpha/beta fold hydrolase [Phycicoccus flavus]|uniref:alpha/beta fold hydrolase n=1 Tax=Phycicoccus flavus TaxID=2502783 RepID=UPI000FEBD5CC|nr:alpha/beta fold hydrolase [Phycicoccus flavus]NHA70206.1 alpha/beta hydrolase [Phycicoccus flavus]